MPARDERWAERQRVLRRIIAEQVVSRQGEILDLLRDEGFPVTQSSVSRDLAELGATKVAGRYVLPVAAAYPGAADDPAGLATSLRAVRTAGPNLLVVLTPPGRASYVGLALDRSGWTGIVGTVAGDDTVFVATSGARDQAHLAERLRVLMQETHHA